MKKENNVGMKKRFAVVITVVVSVMLYLDEDFVFHNGMINIYKHGNTNIVL